MSDDFSRTIKEVGPDFETRVAKYPVSPAFGAVGKKIDRNRDATDEQGKEKPRPFSDMDLPDPVLWAELIEALDQFNRRREIQNSPFAIRLWAQNNGFRVQLINEETGELIQQTKPIQFGGVTRRDIDDIINDLVRERGIVIDLTR
ncbi:MAG TPA: hypothetical protein PLK80_11905 [bacterium]|nr:MAG: hypothetical protein BWY28_00481 [bacterium ADurb.Bin236]HPI77427.1 hypothetical protein [bacterium]HPN93531.1 hypothetical protein [bacterium]